MQSHENPNYAALTTAPRRPVTLRYVNVFHIVHIFHEFPFKTDGVNTNGEIVNDGNRSGHM